MANCGQQWEREIGPHRLTNYQKRIALLALQGANNREIACEIDIKEQSVKNEFVKIYDKLAVRNRVQLVIKYAAQSEQFETEQAAAAA